MGLTSHKVLALTVLIAVVMMVGTVWLWPRLAGKSWQAVLGRIGALLGTQLTVLAALGLVANNYFAFYSSWDDLLGTGETGPVVIHNKADASGRLVVDTIGTASVKGGGAMGREPAQSGEIRKVRIDGKSSRLSTEGYVYLPPQYFQPAYADKQFPAVIVSTGFPGIAENLITRFNYPGAALKLLQEGRMQPTVMVLVRPSPALPQDTECEDVPNGAQSDTYFAKDVPSAIQASYRVSTDPQAWAFMGNSTGGYCALKLAMRHPDVFPTAVALSAYYDAPTDDPTTGDLFGGSEQRRHEANLLWRLRNLPQPKVSVLLAGTKKGDGNYRQETEAFVDAVRSPMKVSYSMLENGGHNFETWSALLPSSLEWLSQHLKVPDRPAAPVTA
ncbi:alpha/beta hydrolase [Streptomyces sp. NRRL WC-3742]|uniref:alpha/beta hydrolase n=1 Tax=Streptomyces sp. NRRL WC-3742 TaxID=1463934 RepID=UPI0004C9E625|nr:alpha/beta hydrolase-fold protein [Streptomyces sp. NRRL WC-3742]